MADKYNCIRDQLLDAGMSMEQATVVERAHGNIHNFNPTYWEQEFYNNGFTLEQAKALARVYVDYYGKYR